MVRAVLFGDVVDDLLAALVAKVNVKIRHGHALGVEEALEDQIVLERVDARDAQRVGADGARARASAGADGNALAARKAYEVPHNEKIIDIPHAADHRKFVFQPFLDLALQRAIAFDGALYAQPAQVLIVRFAARHGEIRQVVVTELKFDVAAPGDLSRAGDGVLQLGEHGAHLLLRL